MWVSWLLPRPIGQHRALELAYTGRVLTAAEADDWGLVTKAVDDDQVGSRTTELANSLAEGPGPAYGELKRLIRGSFEASRTDNAADEVETIARMVTTEDARLLIDRFLDR